jgi:general secretion pathway protein G
MLRPTARRRRRAAFTLMEVLLVVAILLILGSIVVVSFSGIMKGAEEDTTKTQIESISNGVKAYYAQHRQAPEQLQSLVQNPGTTKKTWRRVLDTEEVPKDAWGRDFTYTLDGDGFTITSAGADGSVGTEDDITVHHGF